MTKEKSDILSRDGNHLALMYDHDEIDIDKSLLKYSSIKQEVNKYNKAIVEGNPAPDTDPDNINVFNSVALSSAFNEVPQIKTVSKEYDIIKDSDIHALNIYIYEHIFTDIFSSYNEYGPSFLVGNVGYSGELASGEPKKNFWQRLGDLFSFKSDEAKKEANGIYTFDVLRFFSEVKGITKENKDAYINRLVGYIVALKNCDTTGQVALKEKLLRDMIVNKYESVLYANDLYYVITEDQIVDFVKKTEKGVRLTYVKNFMRALPQDVIKKIEEVNKLEIFDNYAILHYDPDTLAYSETIQETKKRRDPILFGLIRGSNKLYYITDWVDEYCDLTLDKFVETLQIKKDDLKLEETL